MSGSRGSFASWLTAPPPPAAIQVSSQRVSVVVLSQHGASRAITAHAQEPLAPGVVTPALNGVNVHDGAALTAALKAALDRVAPRPRRAALVLPDSAVKVSLLRFEKIPKGQDLEQLIRWQMRKAAPFRIEDAQVSWSEGADVAGGGREYVVEVARRDVIESYERACEAAGAHTGIVDIASLNLVNAVLATQASAGSGDWLLVHVAWDYATLVVVRDGRVIFFRSRPTEAGAHDMTDLVHQTAMYYEDRLGGGAFTRVVLSGASSDPQQGDFLRRQIGERLGTNVYVLDVTGAVALRDRIAASPDLLDTLAPAVGVLLRDRAATPARPSGERVA